MFVSVCVLHTHAQSELEVHVKSASVMLFLLWIRIGFSVDIETEIVFSVGHRSLHSRNFWTGAEAD